MLLSNCDTLVSTNTSTNMSNPFDPKSESHLENIDMTSNGGKKLLSYNTKLFHPHAHHAMIHMRWSLATLRHRSCQWIVNTPSILVVYRIMLKKNKTNKTTKQLMYAVVRESHVVPKDLSIGNHVISTKNSLYCTI